jgi:ribosome-associated protein
MTSLEKTMAAVEAALDRKAYDLIVVRSDHLASIADYFVMVTGRSDVQVQAVARSIEERMGREGERALSIEGITHAHWIVMDYDDVVIHIFIEAAREFYRLERNWSDAETVELPEPYQTQARGLSLRAIG